jgi:glutamate/tyrosine decarboxylase-like PLP-dependent enzyme
MDATGRAAAYLEGLASRPVAADSAAVEQLRSALSAPLPEAGRNPAEVIAFLDRLGSPATVASAGGRYFGFVTGGALPVSLAAQFVAAAWDQNAFSFVSSPAAALFEHAALRWVCDALDLPAGAAGAVTTGATMANLTCLAAARNDVLAAHGWDADRDGLFAAPPVTVILGEEAHASIYKVLSLLGIGRNRVQPVPVDRQGRMRPDQLPPMEGPTILCLQAGNVNSGAFDPAGPIIEAAHQAGAWAHVDGAFGLWALAAPELAGLATGVSEADSWATDAHKWLNVPYDAGIALVRDPAALRRAMSISGAYLLPSAERDALDYTPESSRRARGIEIWAALSGLGRSGLAELVTTNCRQARDFAALLQKGGVEVLNEVVLNQVVVAFGDDDRTRRVIEAVQREGTSWCGGTVWQSRAAMRISVSSWATTDDDIARSAAAILAVTLES